MSKGTIFAKNADFLQKDSKLRHNINLKTLKIVHHSLFTSYLQYGAQLWGQANKESQNKIQVIQNRALRKISFKKLHDPTAQLYKDLKLLKFCDIVHLQNCLLMNQTEQNEKLVRSFSKLKEFLVLKGTFSETIYLCVLTCQILSFQ